MCCGPCSSTLRSRNSSWGSPRPSWLPWPRIKASAGPSAGARAPSPTSAGRRVTPDAPGQDAQASQPTPRSIASCRPTDGWISAARPSAGAAQGPRPGSSTTRASASQPSARPMRRSRSIASNRWFVPTFPALDARTRPTATRPTLGPASGQTAQARRSRLRQVTANVTANSPASAADRPNTRLVASSKASVPRCGLKVSNARTNGSSAKSDGSCRWSSKGSRYAWSLSRL